MKFNLQYSTRKEIEKAMEEARITGHLRWLEKLQAILFLNWYPCFEQACELVNR